MRPRLVTPALPLALAVVHAASSVLAAQIEMVSRDFTRRASASPSVYHPFLLSGDGRLVVFGSSGTNVVANDTNRLVDLFVYDRTLKSNVWDTTHSRWIGLLPQLGEGSEAAELTPDGRYLAFTSSATGFVNGVTYPRLLRRLGAGGSILYETLAAQVYVHDLWSNTTVIASVTPDGFAAGNGDSFPARISADGRFVAFKSRATNLVDLADSNGDAADIFVRDLSSGRTKVISIAPSGDRTLDHGVSDSGGLRMSTNGRYFAFETEAFDVVPGFNDTNHSGLVYWRDRLAATSVLVSRTLSGTFPRYGSASLADLSSDGRYVCFGSYLSNLVAGVIDGSGNPKVFIRDMQLDEAWVVTLSTNNYALSGYGTRFSGNGRHLLFHCDSTAVVPGVPDANGYGRDYFLHDVLARTNAIVTRSISGTGSDDAVIGGRARLSDDGRFVLFMSYGTNFIEGTTTRSSRFYVRDMNANRTLNALQLAPQEPGPGFADTMYEISADGRAVAFLSVTNLDSGVVDGNSAIDLFVAPVYAPRFVGIHPSVFLIGEGIAGETYVVEASEDFSNWTTVNTNVADAAGLFEARDAQPGSGAKRFYRLSWK